MKYLIVFAAVLAFAVGEGEFDFANARPIEDFPFFQALYPQFKRNTTDGYETGSRINGGNVAQQGRFPYQVSVQINILGDNTAWCGGTILSPNYVLTAAHCIDTTTISVTLIFGEIDRNPSNPEAQTVLARNFIIHPQWNRNSINNDIALIRLNEPLTFVPGSIAAVLLLTSAQENELFVEETVTVPGFGTGAASTLRYSTLSVITNLQCQLYFPGFIRDSNMCGRATNGIPCLGDAGGPVVITIMNNEEPPEPIADVLIGIASFGQAGCAAGGEYVFTRLTSYFRFIEDNTDVVIQGAPPIPGQK